MSRKLAREIAFKIIFESEFQIDKEVEEINNELFLGDGDEILDITAEDEKYIMDVVNSVKNKKEEIDGYISNYLKDGWSLDRISKVDVAILELAIYEILYREDIPYKVSANEAVELAKTFSDDTSPAFINGILAEVIIKNNDN